MKKNIAKQIIFLQLSYMLSFNIVQKLGTDNLQRQFYLSRYHFVPCHSFIRMQKFLVHDNAHDVCTGFCSYQRLAAEDIWGRS